MQNSVDKLKAKFANRLREVDAALQRHYSGEETLDSEETRYLAMEQFMMRWSGC